MTAFRACCWGLHGVLLADTGLRRQITTEVMADQGLALRPGEYLQWSLEGSAQQAVQLLLERRGRAVNDQIVSELLALEQQRYCEHLPRPLPIMPGLTESLDILRQGGLVNVLVCEESPEQTQTLIQELGYADYFGAYITADSSQNPYAIALEYLRTHLDPNLQAAECLVIESSYWLMRAARQAGMPILAITSRAPLHMVQRRADWVVDRYDQVDWQALFADSELLLPELPKEI